MTAGAAVVDAASVLTRFEGELRRFVARRVAGADAEDVLQDTLLRVHLGLGSLRDTERLGPWVFRVARNTIADHHRRRAGRPAPGSAEDLPLEEEDDAGEALRAQMAACLEPFLDELPADQAAALRLTDLGGLTQAEAARRLGIPVATLKARVQRGRRKMRVTFEQCCALRQDPRGMVIEMTPHCEC